VRLKWNAEKKVKNMAQQQTCRVTADHQDSETKLKAFIGGKKKKKS